MAVRFINKYSIKKFCNDSIIYRIAIFRKAVYNRITYLSKELL